MAENTVRATSTSLSIVDVLKRGGGMRIHEIADELGVANSTVHKHLQTLRDDGYVVQNDEQYRLGLRFLEVGESLRNELEVYENAKPQVDELASDTGELANLIVEECGEAVYLHTARGSQAVSLDTFPGKRVALHSTAAGKAILANLPADRRETLLADAELEQLTDRTVTDWDRLVAELESVRDEGVAYERGERIPETCCVAAPIITHEGTVHGAISVTGPQARIGTERLERDLAETVTRAADITAINLQYS